MLPWKTGLRAITSYKPTRLHIGIAAALIVVLVVAGAVYLIVNSPVAGVHARLQVHDAEHVHINEPVEVKFDQKVDLSKATAQLDLNTPFAVAKQPNALILTPQKGWDAGKRYTVRVAGVDNMSHQPVLKGWHADFTVQPRVAISSVLVDGKPADPNNASMSLRSKIGLVFSVPMKTSTVTITKDGSPLAANQVQWSPDNTTATISGIAPVPYATTALGVAQGAYSASNEPMTDPAATAKVTAQPLLPTNPSSGIDANFKPVPPIEIVVENSGDARPQSGLQAADIVYEYVSEYSISRMTAIYFNKPPGLVGPVRSCRMINPYLVYAFDGYFECSGASVGTLHYLFGNPDGWPLVPGVINDFDQHNHFYRVGFKAAPHNLYTDGDRAVTIRNQWAVPPPTYSLDPPHDDVDMGQPADAPSVPLHFVQWQYDAGSKQYLRFDHGAPFMDDLAKAQLHAKNVVILHVGFHDAGWVEDDNGGAHSVWYDMLGSGPAEIWSDGKLVHATWHMGQGGAQSYYANNHAPYFTDENGKVIELNSGLTWIHVVGNGQTS